MSDVWARVAIVAGAVALAAGIALLQRARGRRVRDIPAGSLEPGFYLFTSSTCPTCDAARGRAVEALGEAAFEEIPWELRGPVFKETGVDVVPALVVVSEGGRARLYPGATAKALASL